MKILYFNYLWDLWGASLGSTIKPLELFRALEKRGHRVEIRWMKPQPQGNGSVGTAEQGLKARLKPYLSRYVHDPKLFAENAFYFPRELRAIREVQPDVVVARLDLYLASALAAARLSGLPFVLEADCPSLLEAELFQPQYFRIRPLARWLEGLNFHRADAIVTVSRTLKQYILSYGVDPQKVTVVSNGADPAKFSNVGPSGTRARLGWEDKVTVGFVGSFNVWHGLDHLTSLVQRVVAREPRARFLLVGGGGIPREEFEHHLKRNDLAEFIHLVGVVPFEEVPSYVTEMDIVIAPYPKLPVFYFSPVKIFEYMAAGKAIVTTRIGQIAEYLEDGVDAVLCEPDDLEAMTEAVARLASDDRLRRQLGEAARDKLLRQHTWDHKAAQWEEVLEKAVRTRKDLAPNVSENAFASSSRETAGLQTRNLHS
ncbi:MAG: glycosyltransferase family 4 protein [Calditrichaeota bacterium]|nr:glycosyltransferase family 4 protein [Calditrichota bacterium]